MFTDKYFEAYISNNFKFCMFEIALMNDKQIRKFLLNGMINYNIKYINEYDFTIKRIKALEKYTKHTSPSEEREDFFKKVTKRINELEYNKSNFQNMMGTKKYI